MEQPTSYVPYCGTPPLPDEWLTRWNLDPWLLAGVAIAIAAAEWSLRRGALRGEAPARAAALRAGLLLTGLALISPLCALSVALFSARAAQHVLLLFAAAPLLAYGGLLRVVGASRERAPAAAGGAAAGAAFTVLFWAWHAPLFYDATFRSDVAYWAMHGSLLAAAVLFWSRVLDRRDATAGLAGAAAVAGVLVQMGLLGALLTFSTRLVYAPHVLTTLPFGLTAIEDQQLGGLLMWIPGAVVPMAIAIAAVTVGLGRTAGR
jgi:putative membrane protein